MGIATAIAVGATVSAVGGAVAANQAKKAAKGARGERNRAQLQKSVRVEVAFEASPSK